MFHRLVRLGIFLTCWRHANVTSIQEGQPSSSIPNYRQISTSSALSKVFFWRLMSDFLGQLWYAVVCFQRPSLLIRKVRVHVMHFCMCPKLGKVHWRVSRRLGLTELFQRHLWIGSTTSEFCIKSVMWVNEVLCFPYWHSFYQIDHSTSWWTVVGLKWLTLCQECRRAVFCVRYCSSCTPLSFFPFLIKNWSVMPMTVLCYLLFHPQTLSYSSGVS